MISLSLSSKKDTVEEKINKIRSLDYFQAEKSENFKSPISKKNISSFFQYDIDFEKYDPRYTKELKNYFNTQYTIELKVGKQKNKFKFIIDTGSGTTLINDIRCKSQGCQERTSYDPFKSESYLSLHKLIEIKYAKGGVMIELGQDCFFFEDLVIKNQEFGSIIDETAVFNSASYDGILGLSYPALSDQTKPFFDRIIEMDVLPHNIFSIYLSRDSDFKSKLFLGGMDSNYYKGDVIYHNVIRKSWWTLKLNKILLNGKDIGLCNEIDDCEIIMDTGASLMATPPNMYSNFIEQISEFAECEDSENFPTIGFMIDDTVYELEPFEYILSDENEIIYEKNIDTKGLCSIGFSIFDVGDLNVWIAGDIFLTKFFSIYDRDNDRVGLAKAKMIINKDQEI